MDVDGPEAIGGYRVERGLGAGGMGRVFLCWDDALDRRVAVKILQPELLEQEEMRARFLREARALARVSSPHVVAVHSVGEDPASGPFVVMEYLDGEDLHARLAREKRIPWRDAVAATKDAVAGLVAAEAAGIVHRDVKPANLFVVGGKAKLTDFGLAREIAGAHAGVTQAGIVVGTPAYLAPEVIKGSPASHRSDLYSLGATLYHLIAGHPPFRAEAPLEVIAQAVKDEAPPLITIVDDDIPLELSDLVQRMMAKEPADRPASFAALDAELRALLEPTSSPVPQRTMQFAAGATAQAVAPGGQAVAPGAHASAPGVQAAAPRLQASTPELQAGAPGLQAGAPGLQAGAPGLQAAAPGLQADAPGDSGAASALLSASDLPTMDVPMQPAPAPSSSPYAVPASEISVSGPVPRIKTASLTVMMTDIAGYTERTSRVSREESARWLALHDQLLQPVFRSFSGRVIKTLGDAFLVTFPSPTDAVHCACAIQDRLFLHNQRAKSDDAIHVRIALSAGEVRLHKGDVFGEPVNLAARIESIAQPGEVLLSDAVYATMNTSEVRLQSRGEHTLKGIARPVVVYAAVPDNAPGLPPFSGRALGRVKESVVDGFVANAPVAMQRAQAAAEPVMRLLRHPKAVVALAGAAGLLLVVVLLVALLHDSRIARIDHGEAKAVIEEIDKTPEQKRSNEDWAVLGHALFALDDKSPAFAAYKKAVDGKFVDERMKRAVLQALAKKDDTGAAAVLAAWPDAAIETELRALLASDDWWPRHHAMAILEERKAINDAQKQDVGLRDLTSDACGDRRSGVLLLRKIGKGDDVLAALKKLGQDPLNNACLVFDLNGAENEVKKRSAPK
jgi:serine/threonine-protein kinase